MNRPLWRVLALASALALTASATPASAHAGPGRLTLDVLSGAPDRVTGGDALIRVRADEGIRLSDIRVRLNGTDVTDAFHAADGALTGLVKGMVLGRNDLMASARGHAEHLRLTNFPLSGPVFAGPKQYPFLCRTEQAGLGQPMVDNQEGQGLRVFALNADGTKSSTVVGWSKDCNAATVVDYQYRASNGTFKALPADGSRPADLVTTTTLSPADTPS